MPSVLLVGFIEHGWGYRAQRIGNDGWSHYNVFGSFLSIHLMKIIFMLIVSSMDHGIANMTFLMMPYCMIIA